MCNPLAIGSKQASSTISARCRGKAAVVGQDVRLPTARQQALAAHSDDKPAKLWPHGISFEMRRLGFVLHSRLPRVFGHVGPGTRATNGFVRSAARPAHRRERCSAIAE